jgi:hypothetical protein
MAKNFINPPKNTIPASFEWNKASETDPHVVKVAGHDIFHVSSVLLLHSKSQGNLPGFFAKYVTDHPGATPPRKKGDKLYYDMFGKILTDVEYYYPVDKMAMELPKKPAPAKAEKPKAEPAKQVTT